MTPAVKGRLATAAQLLFVVAAVAFAWWALRDDRDEIGAAARSIGPARWLQAGALVAIGTLASAVAWRRMLGGFGYAVPYRRGMAILLVGQLGKYIPGSVWTLGAQAALARRSQIPARVTLVTGLVFIGWHLATAVIVGCTGLAVGVADVDLPTLLPLAGIVAGVVALTPGLVNWLGSRMNRAGYVLSLGWVDTAVLAALFAVTWACFGMAISRLAVGGEQPLGVATAITAFALSYAAGLVVVFAPAGLGARELVLGVVLAPTTGTPTATAVAVSSRLLFTAVDVALAVAASLAAGRTTARPDVTPGAAAAPCQPGTGRPE